MRSLRLRRRISHMGVVGIDEVTAGVELHC
jgi:hypothetical protein